MECYIDPGGVPRIVLESNLSTQAERLLGYEARKLDLMLAQDLSQDPGLGLLPSLWGSPSLCILICFLQEIKKLIFKCT